MGALPDLSDSGEGIPQPGASGADLPVQLLVFDFDGTLVLSSAVKRRAYADIFADVPGGREAATAAQAENPYLSRFEIIRRVLLALGRASEEAVAAYAEKYNEICEAHQMAAPERPGAGAALMALSARLPLALCSGTWEPALRRVVERRGWSGLFRAVLGGPAPKVQNIRRICAGLDPASVLLVGDTRDDLDAARRVGCRFAGMLSEATDFRTDEVVMLRDFSELEAMC